MLGVARLPCLLTIPGWYKTLLSQHHINIDPKPSWEGYSFHDNMGEVDCAQLLTLRGLTLNKADNCHNFTFAWIQEGNTYPQGEGCTTVHHSKQYCTKS